MRRQRYFPFYRLLAPLLVIERGKSEPDPILLCFRSVEIIPHFLENEVSGEAQHAKTWIPRVTKFASINRKSGKTWILARGHLDWIV